MDTSAPGRLLFSYYDFFIVVSAVQGWNEIRMAIPCKFIIDAASAAAVAELFQVDK